MFLSKVKFAVIVLLALGVVGSGASLVAHRIGAEPPAAKPVPVPVPVAEKEKAKEPEAKPKAKADSTKTPEEMTALV